ncbi:cytolethal distending toxin subunit B family protein [Budvicia diplopodorum]|uniref:cytolethal distending toxin subunit B family protein n=1 Tax=Budvicia diplopodorum TaxID=1119056 RepID=UPI001356B875|nr:cytolethal distending toxin subunit B family protein [Budvicia diplopodorum]
MKFTSKRWLLFQIFILSLCAIANVQAGVNKKSTATWNMQGINASSENKWQTAVRSLINGQGHVDILALQEVGAPPISAVINPNPVPVDNVNNSLQQVSQYIWNLGTATRPNNIYIYFLSTGLSRVNLAIATTQAPSRILLFRNPSTGRTARDIMGIRYGNDDYYTYHAGAHPNNEAPQVIADIRNYYSRLPQSTSYQWIVMGDYNRASANFIQALTTLSPTVASNVTVISQGSATHSGGGNLDYAIVGQIGAQWTPAIVATLYLAQLAGYVMASDHAPVLFYNKH